MMKTLYKVTNRNYHSVYAQGNYRLAYTGVTGTKVKALPNTLGIMAFLTLQRAQEFANPTDRILVMEVDEADLLLDSGVCREVSEEAFDRFYNCRDNYAVGVVLPPTGTVFCSSLTVVREAVWPWQQ